MKYIKINPDDNVAVALQDLQAGDVVEGVTLLTDVPRGHKVVLRDLAQGENVIKYGFPIGHVTRNKEAGTVVDHTCIKTNLEGLLDYKYTPSLVEIPPAERKYSFLGFPRTDGQTGIRNQIWVIPTVGCVNGICEELVRRFRTEISGREGSIDAVVAFPHNYGCSQLGPDHENTRTILADMVHHPNAGGVLVVSLGCENNQLDAFRELVGPVDESRVRMFATQKVGDEIEYGLQQLREIFAVASKDERVPVPVSELRVGLKCGGSDG
ncbi:MAG: UxaA family hydrolase, partial [Bacteroidales bacterium]|nr:UxaA family hydrolase [Bacteroidales bacterium]